MASYVIQVTCTPLLTSGEHLCSVPTFSSYGRVTIFRDDCMTDWIQLISSLKKRGLQLKYPKSKQRLLTPSFSKARNLQVYHQYISNPLKRFSKWISPVPPTKSKTRASATREKYLDFSEHENVLGKHLKTKVSHFKAHFIGREYSKTLIMKTLSQRSNMKIK